jgi:hypothetical protein
MGLLEKALRESALASSGDPATSLYVRAAAASAPEAPAIEAAPLEIDAKPPIPPPRPGASLAVASEDLASLEAELLSAPPTYDAYLAAWSKASTVLRLSSIALLMPRGNALVPAARIGFPSKPLSTVPSQTAERAGGGRDPLDKASAEALCSALGVSAALPIRASAVHSASRIAALWVYRDSLLEISPRDVQSKLGAALAASSGRGAPVVAILGISGAPERELLDSVAQSAKASFFMFDLARLSEEIAASCPGVSAELLTSTFASACSSILSGEGAAVQCGGLRIGCALGSATSSDHELALFQFVKSLKRLLPFLAVASFPSGRSMTLSPSSSGAHAELADFLS